MASLPLLPPVRLHIGNWAFRSAAAGQNEQSARLPDGIIGSLSFLGLRQGGGVGAQSKERKGSNFAAQRSGAIVYQARRAKHI